MRRLYTILTLGLLILGSISCKDDSTSTSTSTGSITLTGMTLDYETLDMYSTMEQTLTATYTPSDANAMSLSWSSSDTSVATVYDGTVVAVSAGVATITLTNDISYEDDDGNVYDDDKTVTASCIVTVDPLLTFTLSSIPDDISEVYSNYWEITDSGTPTVNDFATLRTVIYDLGRSMKLEFPNIEGFPAYALKFVEVEDDDTSDDDDDDDDDEEIFSYLCSVKAPLATTIGDEAFYDCALLTEVDFSAVTSLGTYAFAYCELLGAIDMPLLTEIPAGAFYSCDSFTSVDFPLVTSLGSSAFYSCKKLATVEMPSLLEIPYDAFGWCEYLESINSPLVTSIGDWAFGGCRKLASIEMPLATTIGEYAFYNNIKLTDVNLAGAEELSANVFYACTSLTNIDLASTSTSLTLDSTSFGSGLGMIYTRSCVNLTTSTNNGSTINGNYWSVGNNTFEFLSISNAN
ncbi:MAG: leucine-rich repeat domain-containing protein [Rikenellaceae bacterium]